MSETPALSQTTPRLELNAVAPTFTLPAVGGGEVSRGSYRARKHLAVLFLPHVDLPAREYLEELAAAYQSIVDAGAEALAVVTDKGASADGLRAAVDVPFPLLLDPGGRVAARYLPDGSTLGVFILDRYGALRHQWTLTAPPLPAASELISWLEAIDRMCVI
jgi:peroxiredoxin